MATHVTAFAQQLEHERAWRWSARSVAQYLRQPMAAAADPEQALAALARSFRGVVVAADQDRDRDRDRGRATAARGNTT
jgi:hypothetical protein